MTALAQQQQAFLAAVCQPKADALPTDLAPHLALNGLTMRGLAAYRSNAHELAFRVLSAAYPVLLQLLDEDNFRAMALRLWHAHPPLRGDMAQWGGALAQFLPSLPGLLDEEPYLADVARVEWALHQAATAADTQPDLSSLSLLASADPASLVLVLCEGVAWIDSRYPVASIVTAHGEGGPSLAEAGQRLRSGLGEAAMVWRHGMKPCVRQALPGEVAFVAALKERRSLLDSLDAAPTLVFDQWLLPAVQSGLLVGAAVLQSN